MKTDERQARRLVREAFEQMRHGMDISDADCDLDNERWAALSHEATDLMLRAYFRNHNESVL